MRPAPELFQRPRTMLKILYFSEDYELFQKSQGIKFLYDQGRELFHLLAAEAQFETGEAVSAKLLTGEATGVQLNGALRQSVRKYLLFALLILML